MPRSRRGRIALFDIDVQGGAQIRAAWPDAAATVLVLPPDEAELERRLRGRSTDADDVIRRRLAAARAEIARGLETYEFVVVNDALDDALAKLDAIAAHVRSRRAGRRDPAAAASQTPARASAPTCAAGTDSSRKQACGRAAGTPLDSGRQHE